MFRRTIVLALSLLLPSAALATPRVVATIKPVHSLTAKVMDGVGTPALLIKGGASVHSYALKPSDARMLADAQVIFWVGPDLEDYLVAPLNSLAGGATKIALEQAQGVKRIGARRGGLWDDGTGAAPEGGQYDPHIWLSPANAIAMTHAIAAALSKADPAHAQTYASNAAKAVRDIEDLHGRIARELKPVQSRPYIVFHDAYHYFEEDFHLSPLGAVTVSPERPVGPRRVAAIHAVLENGTARCIFTEPEFSPELIDALTENTKARTGVLDPLGADLPPGPALYDRLLEGLARGLVNCLKP